MIIENVELTGSLEVTGSFILPLGGDSDRTSTPFTGSLFYNTSSRSIEIYNGKIWATQSLGGGGGGDTPLSNNIEYLLVAGGGGGGGTIGGGGGAGGLLSSSLSSVTSGSTFTITVGAGGTGGYGWGTYTPPTEGGDSSIAGDSITTITSIGGGQAGDHYGSTSADNHPTDGGSGGGAARGLSYPLAGGSGTVGQGNDGGLSTGDTNGAGKNFGGGGGGAGADGEDAGADADGGIGLSSNITGTSTTYAGGGGGGSRQSYSTDVGEGGTGGGGAGGTAQSATSGTTNTGGGGGGAGYTTSNSGKTGGDGGSGVAIFAYNTSSMKNIGGERTYSGDRVAHIYNSSGTHTISTGTHTPDTVDIFGDSSCVGFYKFDGNVNDSHSNSNHGVNNGSATFEQSYINDGIRLNGTTQYVGISGRDVGFGETVSMWVNIDSLTTDTSCTIWGQSTGGTDWVWTAIRYTVSSDDYEIFMYIRNASSVYRYYKTAKFDLNSGEWNHVAFTYNSGTDFNAYVNGVATDANINVLSLGTISSLPDSNQTIGRARSNNTFTYFPGKIDHVRFFNKQITDAEALILYNE